MPHYGKIRSLSSEHFHDAVVEIHYQPRCLTVLDVALALFTEDVVVYNEQIETLALDVSHGFRKRGEKYFACVSRVSDEFIKSYEETQHRLVQRLVDDILVADAALYAGVVGCTKYEDQWM